jgi:hypothetical protein
MPKETKEYEQSDSSSGRPKISSARLSEDLYGISTGKNRESGEDRSISPAGGQEGSSARLSEDLYGTGTGKNRESGDIDDRGSESRKDSSTRKFARRAAYYGSLGMYLTEGLKREAYIKNAQAYWAYSELRKDIDSGNKPGMEHADLERMKKETSGVELHKSFMEIRAKGGISLNEDDIHQIEEGAREIRRQIEAKHGVDSAAREAYEEQHQQGTQTRGEIWDLASAQGAISSSKSEIKQSMSDMKQKMMDRLKELRRSRDRTEDPEQTRPILAAENLQSQSESDLGEVASLSDTSSLNIAGEEQNGNSADVMRHKQPENQTLSAFPDAPQGDITSSPIEQLAALDVPQNEPGSPQKRVAMMEGEK